MIHHQKARIASLNMGLNAILLIYSLLDRSWWKTAELHTEWTCQWLLSNHHAHISCFSPLFKIPFLDFLLIYFHLCQGPVYSGLLETRMQSKGRASPVQESSTLAPLASLNSNSSNPRGLLQTFSGNGPENYVRTHNQESDTFALETAWGNCERPSSHIPINKGTRAGPSQWLQPPSAWWWEHQFWNPPWRRFLIWAVREVPSRAIIGPVP